MKQRPIGLRTAVIRVTRLHFAYVFLYMLTIIIFDSWNLIAHNAVVWRWQAASTLLIVNAVCWYLARTSAKNRTWYTLIALALILADIIFASLNVYWQRGMASKSVALFIIPILIAAILHSRRAILATATIASAAYSYTVVRYFHLHYGEGYKVELYGELTLYCGLFYLVSLLLVEIMKTQKTNGTNQAENRLG